MVALHTFQNDGFSFDVDDSGGDGEPVVLLHGFPQTRTSWRHVTPGLVEAGYRVLAPDQRGYSPAARPTRRRDYALPLLVGDILALADTAGAERFHVVGHDWGGAVAWGLAGSHPDRVATVTSLSTPHPRAMVASMVRSTQALHSWYMLALQLPKLPELVLGSRRMADRVRKRLIDSGLPADAAAESVELLRTGGARGAVNWYRALPFGSPKEAMQPVTVPTLYVYGGQDFALTRAAADLTGRHVTGPYTYEVLPDVGHWIPETAADTTTRLILSHLEAHPI
ncbi:MAG: alpha/beta fold hydrolase [Acidimicrobiales bacterium]